MRSFVVVVMVLSSGCPDRTVSGVTTDPDSVEVKDIPVEIKRELDLLFVIDKSPTMTDEQSALTASFPGFITVLRQIEGGLPNLHLGVISQDIGAGGLTVGTNCSGNGDAGALLATPRVAGCQPPSGNYISDVENMTGGRTTNYAGTLEDTFSCIAALGPQGCGFEQHLGSLRKALIGNAANAGFLRKDAYLAIVFISDEDDCTAKDPTIYSSDPALTPTLGPLADFRCFEWGWECDEGTMTRGAGSYTNCRPRTSSPYLINPDDLVGEIKALKDDPKNVIVATLMGPRPQDLRPPELTKVTVDGRGVAHVQPSCVNGAQNAFPMPRLHSFAQQFPERNAFYSLCENDLSQGLVEVGKLIRKVIGDPCFATQVDQTDIDAVNPGLQLACKVEQLVHGGTQNEMRTQMPACTMMNETTPSPSSPQPCFYVVKDLEMCAVHPTGLKVETFPANRVVPSAARLQVQCVTETTTP